MMIDHEMRKQNKEDLKRIAKQQTTEPAVMRSTRTDKLLAARATMPKSASEVTSHSTTKRQPGT